MKYLIFLFLMGCSTITYKDGQSEFSRTSYFTVTQINRLIVTIKGDTRKVELSSVSDQVQAVEKVAEGVAKGLASAIKP